jgi:hypothetical protein
MLPRVKPEIIGSRLASLKGGEDQTLIYKRISDENPELWNLITIVLKSNMSHDFKDGYCKAFAQCYGLLISQAEADQMNEDFA